MTERTVVALAVDGVELLDLTGPLQVFSAATRLLAGRAGGYRTLIAAARPGPVTCAGGVRVVADLARDDLVTPVDTLLVPGVSAAARGGVEPVVDPALVAWLRDRGPIDRRTASVCVGAHVLAAAGLLDGRRAATHWSAVSRLAADHPAVDVDPDAVFVRAGRVWTSAGVSTGIDLALALVAEDHGDELARDVARWLVVYLRRPGGQSQFSAPESVPAARRPAIRRLQEWLPGHLAEELSVPALAGRAGLSVRHFARLFAAEVGTTPAAHVEALRVEAACRRLIELDEALTSTATACGFGSVESLHRAFRTRLGVTPSAYRARFRRPADPVREPSRAAEPVRAQESSRA